MIETSILNAIAGGKGSYLLHHTDPITGKWSSLVVQEDSTEISAAVDNNGRDLLIYWNISGQTLYKGAFLSVPLNSWIASVTLASGTAIGYNA